MNEETGMWRIPINSYGIDWKTTSLLNRLTNVDDLILRANRLDSVLRKMVVRGCEFFEFSKGSMTTAALPA